MVKGKESTCSVSLLFNLYLVWTYFHSKIYLHTHTHANKACSSSDFETTPKDPSEQVTLCITEYHCLLGGVSDKEVDHQDRSSASSASSASSVCETQRMSESSGKFHPEKTLKINFRKYVSVCPEEPGSKIRTTSWVGRPSSLRFEVTVNRRPSRTVAPLFSLIILSSMIQ